MIVLLTGSETKDYYVANVAPAGAPPVLGLVPNPTQPAGYTYTDREKFAAKASAPAYAACGATYAAPPFVAAGWTLQMARITGIADINTALAKAAVLNPIAAVVHYVGHGNTSAAGKPVWSCRGPKLQDALWTGPGGAQVKGKLLAPADGNEVEQVLVSDVKDAMKLLLPGIPLTLISDGCDNQPVYDLGEAGFRVIVCDTTRWDAGVPPLWVDVRDVQLGLFSSLWATAVTPNCFSPDDAAGNGRPAALKTVNAAMKPVKTPPQIAAANPP